MRPVWRFNAALRLVHGCSIGGRYCDFFERAVERCILPIGCGESGKLDVGKNRGLYNIFFMTAHADADVQRIPELDARRSACKLKFAVFSRKPHREIIAMLDDTQMFRRPEGCLHFMGQAAFLITKLQCGHSIAVQRDVRIRRIRL